MAQHASSLIDVGTEAMLELEEMVQEIRRDAPALKELLQFLRTPRSSPTFAGNTAVSMLADVRAYPVLRDATGLSGASTQKDFEEMMRRFLNKIEQGVDKEDKAVVKEAKVFCSSLIGRLIAKDMADVFAKKETLEPRRITNVFI